MPIVLRRPLIQRQLRQQQLLLHLRKMQMVYGIIPVAMDVQGEPELLVLVVDVVVPWLITRLIISKSL